MPLPLFLLPPTTRIRAFGHDRRGSVALIVGLTALMLVILAT